MLNRFVWLVRYAFKYLCFMMKQLFNKYENVNWDVVVIGNGPSFNDSLKNNNNLFKWKDILVVNSFLSSEYFKKLKPKYYVIADPAFFMNTKEIKWGWAYVNSDIKRIKDVQNNFINWLINDVTRDITLFIPFYLDISEFLSKIEVNQHIDIQRYNTTPINIKYNLLRNFLYKHKFWMPTAQNVLITSIYIVLNLWYKNIYLVGWDYSWFENYYIDKNNTLFLIDKHFYDDTEKKIPILSDWKPVKMHEQLYSLYKAFKWHVLLESYAKYIWSHVINASEKSYIDAYDRLK